MDVNACAENTDSASDIIKYEKKLTKALKKRKQCSDDSNSTDLEEQIQKYERKIAKARKRNVDSSAGTSAASSSRNGEASAEPVEVDKSGMTLLLFYAYVEPIWKPAQHSTMIEWARSMLESNGCTGRLRVSREGFNGTLTGPFDGIRAFTEAMREHPGRWFSDMLDHDDFKYTDNLPVGQMFPKLKVFPVKELVNYGLGLENPPSVKMGAVHLDAKAYHEKMKEPNTVIIDVRNTYEADIGRFTPVEGGAEYIDPKMRVSTEFPLWVKNNIEELKKKQVMMYCTGGIRCERASALVRSLGHDNVYQLKGGIHKYLEAFPEGSASQWSGKNYTFDKRFAHGAVKAKSGEAGPAGSDAEGDDEDEEECLEAPPLPGDTRPRSGSLSSTVVVGKCHGCDVPWEKYRGRKRCPVCGVPLLLCHACLENTPAEAKCTLCKEDATLGRRPFTKANHRREVAAAGPILGGGGGGKKKVKTTNICGVCEEMFKSRNALFKHLNDTGHKNRKAKKNKGLVAAK